MSFLRRPLTQHTAIWRHGFRWRGTEISRIEGLSDAVIGFAMTLLVVSLEVPRTFDELLGMMRGLPAFAATFATMIYLWYRHHLFFRCYGLTDRTTVVLNAVFLFVMLYYVYPLKFLFQLAVAANVHLAVGSVDMVAVPVIRVEQSSLLFTIYGIGFAAMFLVLAMLEWHAYRHREDLELNAVEEMQTRCFIVEDVLFALVGLLSIALANTLPPRLMGWAGWCYGLMGLVGALMGTYTSKALDRAAARMRQ